MVLFDSSTSITIYTIITSVLLFAVILRTNPLSPAAAFVRMTVTSRKYLLHLLMMFCILFVNKLQLQIENAVDLEGDFTPLVYSLEGSIVANIQELFQNDILTLILVFFYVAVLPSLMALSVGIYTYTKQYHLYYAFCYAIMLNYLIAIPFYFFVPINEVWAYPESGARFIMLDAFPGFEDSYRNMSGLNNCFPSLHTSLSVTLALLAWRSGIASWKWIAAISAGIIVFSIFYLGIHWFTDMFGGLILAWFASSTALKLTEVKQLKKQVG